MKLKTLLLSLGTMLAVYACAQGDVTGIMTPPAGQNGQVQFNKKNAFGADVNFTYSTTTAVLGLFGYGGNLSSNYPGIGLTGYNAVVFSAGNGCAGTGCERYHFYVNDYSVSGIGTALYGGIANRSNNNIMQFGLDATAVGNNPFMAVSAIHVNAFENLASSITTVSTIVPDTAVIMLASAPTAGLTLTMPDIDVSYFGGAAAIRSDRHIRICKIDSSTNTVILTGGSNSITPSVFPLKYQNECQDLQAIFVYSTPFSFKSYWLPIGRLAGKGVVVSTIGSISRLEFADGTNQTTAGGGGGGSGGYAVEPATKTFLLDFGARLSTFNVTGLSPGVMHIVATSSNAVTALVSLSTEVTGVLPLANMTNLTTFYIANSATLTPGTTFFTSSGSIAGQLDVSTLTITSPTLKINTVSYQWPNSQATNRLLKNTGPGTLAWSQATLTTDVTGTLPMGNGGTNVTTLALNGVLYGNAATSILATAAGAANTVLVSATGAAPTFSGSPVVSTISLINVLKLPATSTHTVTSIGQVVMDTDAVSGSMGAILAHDGTQLFYVVGTTNPPVNGFVPKFNSGTGKIIWDADSTGASVGDNLGNHVATMTLTASFGINASTVAVSTITLNGGGFIKIGDTISGVPSIVRSGQQTTGIGFDSSNQINLAVSGTPKIQIAANQIYLQTYTRIDDNTISGTNSISILQFAAPSLDSYAYMRYAVAHQRTDSSIREFSHGSRDMPGEDQYFYLAPIDSQTGFSFTDVVHVNMSTFSANAGNFGINVGTPTTKLQVGGEISNINQGTQMKMVGVIFSSTNSWTLANTVTQSTITVSTITGIGTLTIPANFLRQGHQIRITAMGGLSCAGTQQIQVRLCIGTNVVVDSGLAGLTAGGFTNKAMMIIGYINIMTTGVSGQVSPQMFWNQEGMVTGGVGTASMIAAQTAPVNVDMTVSNDIQLSFRWGAANASNIVRVTNYTVEIF
jgi:hypothetical protein